MKEHLYRLALGAIAIAICTAVCLTVCGFFRLIAYYPTPGAIILAVLLSWIVGTLIRWCNETN